MRALIIANGSLPPIKIIRRLLRSADYIVCADGGANHARTIGITPDCIIGDMDSITSLTKKYFKKVMLVHISNQNSTDLEKAIDFCIKKYFELIDVVGATGDRIDHTVGSLGCFKKYGRKSEFRFIDSVGELTLIRGVAKLTTRIGEQLSLIPLNRCTGITTTNLKYPLKNDSLELGIREGTSNEATARRVSIKVKNGTLLLYRFHGLSGI